VGEAYIVGALRTAVGRKKGALSAAHPADLGAHVIKAVVDAAGVDPAAVDDVVFGCVDAIGSQAATSRAPRGWPPGCPRRCRGSPWTGSAAPPSRRCTSRRRRC